MTGFFAWSRLPALYGIALALLLGTSWLRTGSVAPAVPQTVANHAYRELWLGHSEGPKGAINMFRQALAMDAAFPYRWSDFGEALASAGQLDSARYCLRRALELAPDSPQIALRAANLDLREGEVGPALQLGAAALRLTSDYDGTIFNSWIRFANLNQILQTGIGTNPRAADSFFRFLIGINSESRLFDTWKWMEDRSYITDPQARMWTDWLIGRQREGDAQQVWKRYVALDAAYGVSNWIDNGGFEKEPAGRGFDWRIEPSTGVKVTLDPAVAHSGHASLRLDFDGTENLDFHHIAQRVWLPPGRYRLTAWMRTKDLSTDSGVTLALSGASTPGLTGIHDWTRVSADINVRGNAAAGEVRLVRQRSWRFDGKLSGVVWIDDVELRMLS